jgi:hypothetical protein
MTFRLHVCSKQVIDERDLACDPRLFVMDVAMLVRPDRLNAAESCFCRSQGSVALSVAR